MNFEFASAWAVMLSLAASLAMTPAAAIASIAGEDRSSDAQADVWQLYDEEGDRLGVLSDPGFDGCVAASEAAVVFTVALQPCLLPRSIYMGDRSNEERAPAPPARSTQFHTFTAPSGRAPPSAR